MRTYDGKNYMPIIFDHGVDDRTRILFYEIMVTSKLKFKIYIFLTVHGGECQKEHGMKSSVMFLRHPLV